MAETSQAVVRALWAGGRGAPGFLASGAPELSWRVDAPAGWRQRAYELEVAPGASSVVESNRSQAVPWPGDPLPPSATAAVRVRVRGQDGAWSHWSEPELLRTGPLGAGDWTASLVALPGEPDDRRGTVRFRRVIDVRDGLVAATLSVTAHGIVEAVVNGSVVGDEVLVPGWTAYDRRLLFATHDVTTLLHEGENVLGATVAEGWYRERFGFGGAARIHYPGPIALAAQLRLEYEDGTVEIVGTDGSWTASASGPVVAASIYQGEHLDARLDDAALADPAVPLPGAVPVAVLHADPSRLQPQAAPPIRRIEHRGAERVLTSPSGRTLLDFGQNLVGWVEADVDLPEGAELVLRHAEVLEHGELGTRPLRFAAATDRFVSDGRPRTWSPRFTYHGFRYVEVTGWAGAIDAARFRAVVVHSDLVRTGTLETSDPLLNRLHENVVWGLRGNFVGIPTDCPQRDERLGWTGDIQVFAPTASFLFDVDGFLRSWLTDLALEQEADGAVPFVVPSVLPGPVRTAAAWADAATLVPDTLHARFGDEAVLAAQYPSMRALVEAEHALAGDDLLWTGGFQFGDWLDPAAPPHRPQEAKADPDVVATACFFRSTDRLAAAARVLGLDADAAEYADLADRIRAAFVREFVTERGRLVSDAPTAYALAIAFGLVAGEQRDRAGDRLAELVRAFGFRIRTGFVGTPLICDALTATGHVDVAYRLLTERGNPSWLYPVTMGATTVWERWDSMLPDGSINPGEMTSFNHYALGAVADWMHRVIGGIAPAAPGYRQVTVRPVPGGGLTRAAAALETGFGRIATDWSIADDTFRLRLEIPVGVDAAVELPDGTTAQVGHGTHDWVVPFAEPRPVRAPVTLDTPLVDLVDDPEARAAVEDLFREVGYAAGLAWSETGSWRSDTRIRDGLSQFPEEALGRLEEVIAEVSASRAP